MQIFNLNFSNFSVKCTYFLTFKCPLFSFFQLDVNELNNTRKAKKEVLFFNRVPKVGSQTTMELLKSLSIKNNFHYHKDRTQKVETIKLTYNEEVTSLFLVLSELVVGYSRLYFVSDFEQTSVTTRR